MTDRKAEGQDREAQTRGRVEGRDRQDKRDDFLAGHPPIIIPDGLATFRARGKAGGHSAAGPNDILVGFDGEDEHRHYEPEDPPHYTSGQQLIEFIEVEDEDGEKHRCVDPGNYRVVVTDKHRHNNNESRIIVDATSNARIDITFPEGGYERKHGNGKRKMLLGALKKIKSLQVFDPDVSQTDPIHTCELVRSGKEVVITIRDKFR
jgi:hypothetical protein